MFGNVHGISFDHLIDTEAGNRLLATIEKDSFTWSAATTSML
jgi:hypothetical protein